MIGRARRPLSLRARLMLGCAGLSIVTIAGVSATLTALHNQEAMRALRDKATRYALLIAPQLRPVVAFDDRLTAHEVLDSFAADSDVAGLAVYSQEGSIIGRTGRVPPRLSSPSPPGRPGHVVVVAPIVSAEGPRGRLYVSLSTAAVVRATGRSYWTALATGLIVLAVALLLANRLSQPVARRIATIAAAAERTASGDLEQPALAPGADDEVGHLIRSFNVMVAELRRQFVEREQLSVTEQARLESLVAARTAELEESKEQYRLVAESTTAIPFTYEPAIDRFTYVGPQAGHLQYPLEAWRRPAFLDVLLPEAEARTLRERVAATEVGRNLEFESTASTLGGDRRQLRWVMTCGDARSGRCLRGLILDISDQRRFEQGLAQARKLESVGRLAAGVAHEINTPVQFVSDSVHFVRDGLRDIDQVLQAYRRLHAARLEGDDPPGGAAIIAGVEEEADLDYLSEQLPRALDRSIEGLNRIATIVRSMKAFAHPDATEMSTIDLNAAIESTLTIARTEYKYVADVVTDLGPLPDVRCHAGEINQAILNIVVNAAHAIGDVVSATGARGVITIRTRQEGDDAVVSIGDTGGGIPEALRERIFDPFFTTKGVGRGTGQGLAIARSVIVDTHGGDLTFDTVVGAGTTFTIRLPIAATGDRQHAA